MRTSKKISILVCLALCFVALLALTSCFGGDGITEGEHVHTEEIIPGVEATCTEDGLTEGKKCSDCGEILVAQETIAASHKEEIIPAVPETCTEDGLTEGKKCSDCGEILVEQKKKDAVGKHKFENSYTCTLCNTEIYKESQGLLFEISGDNTYYIVVGIGDCADTEIVIPYTHEGLPVLAIGDSAFSNRNLITAVIIPESVTTIGESAFSGCTSLVSVSIPDGVSEIKSRAFSGCILLTIVIIGKNVASIGDGAFDNCEKLTIYCTVQNQPSSWNESWNTASRPTVWGHTHTVEIIPGVEPTCSKEGLSEGKKCSDCGKILLEQKPLRKKDHSEKKVPAVEATCAEIGLTEGKECSVCGEVLVEQEVVDKLSHTEEILPAVEPTCAEEGLTEGKKCAVCDEVLVEQQIVEKKPHTEKILPAKEATCTQRGLTEGKGCSVCGEILVAQKTIQQNHIFENNYICVLCNNEIYKESQGILLKLSEDNTHYIVSGIDTCADTEIVIPYTYEDLPVTTIGDNAFENCKSITGVVIPNSVKSIGSSAFYNCTSIESITIPDSVNTIGEAAFYNCTSLTSIEIPDNVTSIGKWAFSRCAITTVVIPNSVTSIGELAFYNCTSLESLTIGNSVTSIGANAFAYCTSLTEIKFNAIAANDSNFESEVFGKAGTSGDGVKVTIGKDVTKIPTLLFYTNNYERAKIISVDFEEGSVCESIGSRAFYNCTSLKSITIGNSVTSIGESAFYQCRALTEIKFNAIAANDLNSEIEAFEYAGRDGDGIKVTIGKDVTKIPAYLFYGSPVYSPEITSVEFEEDSVCESIGIGAFYNCTSLKSITIGNSVTSIGSSAFYQCSSLENITIPNSVNYIESCAFDRCTSLESVTIPDSVTSIGGGAFRYCYSLTIYCEAESKLSGWDSDWNYSNRPVVWGHTHSYTDGECVCGMKEQ